MIDGDAVIHELVLPAPAERVFDMFTDPRQLVRWIGISADLQPRPGGRFRFEVVPGQFCEGQYVIIDRPARLAAVTGGGEAGSYLGEEPAGRLTALRGRHDRTGSSWAGRAP